ncbi:hypothetical protein, conserved [Babesia ovata]|uniref:C3H1-type domain-containing protein n=1 Tax=Babesia ovata TaxID=189622 RepID=A0A2H6KJG1_9APIC|nr:uncharacterized protein BOVATA_046190 [Babesia ovata]GBE63126.1 hypothetical protein, conserved [Babesia ovata]
MAFLHGVLQTVKEDESVTTYDNDKSNDINNVLDNLHDNVGKGREAFGEAVTQVDTLTKNVTTPIARLKTQIGDNMKKIEDEKDNSLIVQVNEWSKRAGQYIRLAEQADEAREKLDPQLSGKLHNNISLLLQATKAFLMSAGNDDLKAIYETARGKMEDVVKYVEGKFEHSIAQLKLYLETYIGNLRTKLENLQNMEFAELVKSVNVELYDALKTVSQSVDTVIERYGRQIVPGVEDILQDARSLKDLVLQEKRILKEQVANLGHRITALCKVGNTVKEQVPSDDLERFRNDHDDTWNLTKEISQLKNHIVSQMKQHVCHEILKKIATQVATIKTEIGEVTTSKNNAKIGKGIMKEWEQLRAEVSTSVRLLKGTGSDYSGLNGIKYKIADYANLFKNNFNKLVGSWLEKILAHNGLVKDRLQSYVNANKSGKLNPQFSNVAKITDEVKSKIIDKINEFTGDIITPATQVFKAITPTDASIKENIDAVTKCCETFAGALEAKIKSKADIDAFIKDITDTIEKTILQTPGLRVNPIFLKIAVEDTLVALSAAARRVAKMLKSFTTNNNKTPSFNLSATVELAIANVESINNILGDETGNGNAPGSIITRALDTVKTEITQLHTNLGKALVEANPDRVLRYNLGPIAEQVKAVNTKLNEEAVNNPLKDLLKEACTKGITELNKRVTDIVGTNVKDANDTLEGIKSELVKLQTEPGENSVPEGVSGGKSHLEKDAGALHSRIQEFLKTKVGENGRSADTVYKDLVAVRYAITSLGEKVVDVSTKVGAVGDKLNECIADVNTLLKYAPKVASRTMKTLHTDVNAKITEGFEAIQYKAKDLYKKRKTEEITALQNIVTTQLDEINGIIFTDGSTGTKGLLNAVSNNLKAYIDTVQYTDFNKLSNDIKSLLDPICDYVSRQVQSKSSQSHSPQVDRLKQQLDNLLNGLKNSSKDKLYHFDHTFTSDLAALNEALSLLTPQKFNGHQHPELLDALTAGAKRLADELDKQYVNRYSGLKWADIGEPDREKCAKVLLTIFTIVHNDLNKLKTKCESKWSTKQINSLTELGLFLQGAGYDVSASREREHAELQNSRDMTGQNIIGRLANSIENTQTITHLTPCIKERHYKSQKNKTKFHVMDLLACLTTHLNEYNRVCHLSTSFSKRSPCSVNEMLCWLSGLPHNHIYPKLKSHITSLFEVEDKSNPPNKIVQPVDAYPSQITYRHVHDALTHMVSHSQTLLCTIVGHGDSQTTYGCDFTSNALRLTYSSSPATCFDTLVDVLRRLYSPLKFLQIQCKYSARDFGWRDCSYGNTVDYSNWQCKNHSSTKPQCQPNDKPNCQPTSPLMSYLNDCLPGHLPHELTSIGCTSVCLTCPKVKKGMPCLTPLGFRQFSGSSKIGSDLCSVLDDMCESHGVLSTLYSMINCLVTRPPQTLCDVFTFYCRLTQSWNVMNELQDIRDPIQKAVCEEITDTVSCKYDDAKELLNSCRELYNGTSHSKHDLNAPDLMYLVGCTDKQRCGGFMVSLNYAAYSTLAPKYAKNYLSYLIYTGPKLQKFLEELKESLCRISCYDSGCSTCISSAGCQVGKHGTTPCGSSSMIECRGVLSVFYQYGITFADISLASRKRCHHLQKAIDGILNSELLKNFLEAIDNFFLAVRKYFIWTLLTLWSLSLLYLLHITVVRLDVLRIRSHLRSPSSHRIAAQSLLAAARVKALANVKYFSP